ncbi:MAG: hypothetical protein ACK58L_15975 [Planctomycetota bacterium]
MNWRLILSGLKSPGWVAYGCVLVTLALVLSLWLLRLERKLVSRSVGWLLLGLRTGVLLTLLLLLLQPVLTKQFDISVRGRVVIAVDGSQSMETRDRHASLAEKLRWAQSLGMVGNNETTQLLDQWVAAADAGAEPDWLGAGSAPATDAERASASARAQQVQETLNELAEMPRVEFVQRLLQAKPKELLAQLGQVMPLDLRVFALEQENTNPKELSTLLGSDRDELVPGGTDAIQFLQSLTAEEGANQIRGVVRISDGRQTAPGDVTGLATRLRSLNIPIFSVPIGSKLPPRDLSIAAIEAPTVVFLNDQAQIRATIGTSGFEGESLSVRLEKDGVEVERQSITPAADTVTVSFVVPSDQAGRYAYQLITEVQAGELRDDNNQREVNLQVVDNKARVMLVDGDPRWEFRYLKNLLERDKQVDSQLVLFRQPYLNLLNQPYISATLPALDAFREQLSKVDLVVLGDVSPDQVDPGVWDVLEKAVSRDGLTLVVVPGRTSMPHAFNVSQLTSMLPILDCRQRIAEQFVPTREDEEQSSFQLTLSPEAVPLPMFQLSADPAERNLALSSLPGHPWIYGANPKPGASVWATSSIPGGNVAPEPTILHHDYGFGQVVWMGLDSTWRWRFRAGDQWHYKFWGQLIRWAARNKASAGNDDVRLTLSDMIVDESDPLDATVRWNPGLLPQLAGAHVEIIATPIDSAPSDFETRNGMNDATSTDGQSGHEEKFAAVLESTAETPERFTGRLPRLAPGTWQLELQVSGGTVTLKEPIRSEVLIRRQLSAELANVSCHRELLTQLSELSGGTVVEPADTESLLKLIQPRDDVQERIQERTLWDHWIVLVVMFSLLMSEWVIRKLNGLP